MAFKSKQEKREPKLVYNGGFVDFSLGMGEAELPPVVIAGQNQESETAYEFRLRPAHFGLGQLTVAEAA